MNPPYAFDGSRGGRQGVYGNGQTRDSTQGMVKIREMINNKTRQSIRQGLHVLVKEAVVPKEAETSKEAGRSM